MDGTKKLNARLPGFTLIELLVVIGIVAVLIGILMPALSAARTAAVRVQCQANLRSVHQMFHLYAVDYRGQVPLGYRGGNMQWNTMVYSQFAGDFVLFGRLYPAGYMDSPEAFYCPAERHPQRQFNTSENRWPASPDETPTTDIQGGYASTPIVEWGFSPTVGGEAPVNGAPMPRLDDLRSEAVFADTMGLPERLDDRHVTGVHVLYADSHVQWVERDRFDEPLSEVTDVSGAFNDQQLAIWDIFHHSR